MSTNHWKLRTKFLLWLMGGIIVVAIGLIIWGVANGRIKSFADVLLPWGNGAIGGIITKEGGVVSGATVLIFGNSSPSINDWVTSETTSNDAGKYRFQGLQEDISYLISAEKGCLAGYATVDDLKGEVAKNIYLSKSRTESVQGTVKDVKSDEPIKNADVSIDSISLSDPLARNVSQYTYTDSEGKFLLQRGLEADSSNFPVGRYSIRVRAEGFREFKQTVTLQGCIDNVFDIKMQRAYGYIEGKVTYNGKTYPFTNAGPKMMAIVIDGKRICLGSECSTDSYYSKLITSNSNGYYKMKILAGEQTDRAIISSRGYSLTKTFTVYEDETVVVDWNFQ